MIFTLLFLSNPLKLFGLSETYINAMYFLSNSSKSVSEYKNDFSCSDSGIGLQFSSNHFLRSTISETLLKFSKSLSSISVSSKERSFSVILHLKVTYLNGMFHV